MKQHSFFDHRIKGDDILAILKHETGRISIEVALFVKDTIARDHPWLVDPIWMPQQEAAERQERLYEFAYRYESQEFCLDSSARNSFEIKQELTTILYLQREMAKHGLLVNTMKLLEDLDHATADKDRAFDFEFGARNHFGNQYKSEEDQEGEPLYITDGQRTLMNPKYFGCEWEDRYALQKGWLTLVTHETPVTEEQQQQYLGGKWKFEHQRFTADFHHQMMIDPSKCVRTRVKIQAL